MWSDVSPFSFREVAPEQTSDLRIGGRRAPAPSRPGAPAHTCAPPGFYPANHTDCLVSARHHCFDGPTGELAHAFFPPHGGIHFDDSEYWVLGPTRYSWKKGDGRPPVGPPHHGGPSRGLGGRATIWGLAGEDGEVVRRSGARVPGA